MENKILPLAKSQQYLITNIKLTRKGQDIQFLLI